MNSKELSAELRALAAEHYILRLAELADIIEHGLSEPATPTEALASQLRTYRHKNPDVTKAQIAARHGVSVGFVSESLDAKPVLRKAAKKVKVKKPVNAKSK